MPSAPPIILTAFSGEQPRVIPRLMPETAAQSARDVRLDDGGLTPIRMPATALTEVPLTWKTIYKFLGNWLGWNNVVNAVPGPIAEDRLYYTGDGDPKMLVNGVVYNLAIARPLTALSASVAGGSGDKTSRLYAYTYVTALGEESEPSPVSNTIAWMDGCTVTLSGFVAAPALVDPRGPYRQRIYRTQTGSSGTGLYFIAERANITTPFTDDLPVNAIAEPCPSIAYNAPPDDLEGLIGLPNGMMCAYGGATASGASKKKLYFCEPYKPHAWPEKYALTVDSEIMGLGAMNMMIVVTTTAQPYIVSGTLPENMTSSKTEHILPCINKRSLVDLGYAIAYATNEGIVIVQASGAVGIASNNIFNRDGWLELNPTTMIGAQLNSRYYAFYDRTHLDGTRERGALILDLANPNFLVRTDAYARAAYYDLASSALYYAPVDIPEIRLFDAPNTSRKRLYWRSKEFVLPYPENYGAILIDTVPDFTIVDQEAAADAAAERMAENAAAIAARWPAPPDGSGEMVSLEGDIACGPIGFGEQKAVPPYTTQTTYYPVYAIGHDKLLPMPRSTGDLLILPPPAARSLAPMPLAGAGGGATVTNVEGAMTVGVYADKQLIAGIGTPNRAVRLPSGFKARTWEIDVATDQRIYRITLAKTVDDLKRQP